jgi:hypothetical protein
LKRDDDIGRLQQVAQHDWEHSHPLDLTHEICSWISFRRNGGAENCVRMDDEHAKAQKVKGSASPRRPGSRRDEQTLLRAHCWLVRVQLYHRSNVPGTNPPLHKEKLRGLNCRNYFKLSVAS